MESASAPVMATDEQLAATVARRAMRAEGMRECSTCHRKSIHYWTSSRIKNCSDCRERNRRKHRLAEERKVQRQAMVAQMLQNARKVEQGYDDDEDDDEVENILTVPQTVSAPPVLRPVQESSQPGVYKPTTYQYVPIPQSSHTMSVSARGTTKMKKPKTVPRAVVDDRPLKDLDADEQDLAIEQMRQRLAATVEANKASAAVRTSGTSRRPDGREYQTASALYESLKKRTQSTGASQKKCTFHGYHAIVANENIDNAKRIELVTNDLRKIARLPFDHTHPARAYDPHTHASTTSFRCTCLGYEAAKPQPLALKGTPGDLIKMARQANHTANLEPTPRLCGGKVTITAVEDKTHPLRLLGQRIIVRVDHKS